MRCSCWLLPGVAALVAVAGCAEPIGTVSGQVRYRGAPLTYGQITVFRDDGRSASTLIEGGFFEMHKVPVGNVSVTVQALSPPGKRTMMFRPDGSADEGQTPVSPDARGHKVMAIPERYKDSTTSGLSFTVHAGEQTHDIDLAP